MKEEKMRKTSNRKKVKKKSHSSKRNNQSSLKGSQLDSKKRVKKGNTKRRSSSRKSGRPQKVALKNLPMTKDKKILNAVGNLLFYAVLILILVSAVLMNVSDKDTTIFGYKVMTVLTDSMNSKDKEKFKDGFSSGSLVVIKNVDPYTLQKGDIITFNPVRNNKKVYLTHRVKEIDQKKKEERLEFITTQGDANDGSDVPIAASQVNGKVVRSFNNAGFFLSFIKKHIVVVAILVSTLV